MKIVKYIFLLLLLAIIAITVFIATQEGRYDITKERIIQVPKTVLYNYINDYRNWENIGILTNNDSTAVFTHSDNTSGAGAQTSWNLNGAKGQIQTLKVVENDSILQKAVIDNQASDINWAFKDTLGGTKVSVRMAGRLSFTDKAYALLKGGVEEKLEATLNEGLNNLNTFLVHELNTYDVEVKGLVTKTAAFYLGHSGTSTITGFSKKAGEVLPKLLSFIKTNNIATNGAPFTIYKGYDAKKDSVSFTICVPIKEEIITTPGSEFEGGKLEAFTALKTTLKGDYSHLSKAWNAARRHITEKGLQENTTGRYVEVYTRGSRETKKPSGWATDIYIPIGAPAVIPPSTADMGTTATSGTAKPKPASTATVTKPAVKPTGTATPKPMAGTEKETRTPGE